SAGRPPARDLDLVAAVRAAVDLARPGFEWAGLYLRLDLPAARPRVRAEPDQLRQVLANLLQNAERYTPRGGVVTVTVRPEAGSALVAVSNRGVEIPA